LGFGVKGVRWVLVWEEDWTDRVKVYPRHRAGVCSVFGIWVRDYGLGVGEWRVEVGSQGSQVRGWGHGLGARVQMSAATRPAST